MTVGTSDAGTTWTAGRILETAAAWTWLPDGSQEELTDDYHLVAYPERIQQPTEVVRCRSSRPAAELVAEVVERVRAWRRDEVAWRITAETAPADLEQHLQEAGARRTETLDILAFDMREGLPDVGETTGRSVLVDDDRTLRAAHAVACEVWGDLPPTEEQLAAGLAELAQPIEERGHFKVVAFVGEEPACSAGCTLAEGVARLWGAATRPVFRGHGCYRAVLEHRLEIARRHGATLALVKGRVATSGPILRRAGFRAYGEERHYTLPV